MKRKSMYLIIFLMMGFIATSSGQKSLIELSFTAKYAQEHVLLDSILIMNLTSNTDTMLYAPDTVLVVQFDPPTGLNEHGNDRANNFYMSSNYPNPFSEHTSIDIFIDEADGVEIGIYDLSGRKHGSYNDVLEAGKHTFVFHPGNENFYLLSASFHGMTRSVKIANPTSSGSDCKLVYKSFTHHTIEQKDDPWPEFHIHTGENLRYIGYVQTPDSVRGSGVIEDIPENTNNTHQFDISEGIPCIYVPTVVYDGVTYHTLQIGSQCWLKENMNTGIMIPGIEEQLNDSIVQKYCYANMPANCDLHGGLYQWGEAMDYGMAYNARGICPPGWHLPSDEDFKELEGAVDSQFDYPDPIWDEGFYRGFDVGKRLKTTTGWMNNSGTNYVGFAALATGCRFVDGTFVNMGGYTSYWTTFAPAYLFAWYRYLEYDKDGVCRTSAPKEMGRSVRCLKASLKENSTQ